MKNIITTILITLLTYSLYAQVPGIGQVPFGMKYQAVAHGADGQPMNSENIGLRFSILRDSENGTVIYTEERLVNTNDLGLFVVTIGSINLTDFSNIDWRLGDHFLQVEVQDNGNWIDLGTHQLLSVPYATMAGNGKLKDVNNQDEFLRFHGTNGSFNVSIGGNGSNNNFNNGTINLLDEDGNPKASMSSSHSVDAGTLVLSGENNNNIVTLGSNTSSNHGTIRAYSNGNLKVATGANADGNFGTLTLWGDNGSLNTNISNQGNNDHGGIRVYDDESLNKGEIISAPSRGGAVFIRANGANGSRNVELSPTGNDNHGRVCVFDENGTSQICLFIDGNGNGSIAGDIKNFRMNHPQNSEKEIWYASIEGPEAAAYERGTAQLVDGEVRVDFSEHFELVVNPTTLTVTLTPLDAASKGLAVVEKTATGFIVKELGGGTGNYQFDWRVEGVRKGYEDFEVIRDKAEMERMLGIDTEEK